MNLACVEFGEFDMQKVAFCFAKGFILLAKIRVKYVPSYFKMILKPKIKCK